MISCENAVFHVEQFSRPRYYKDFQHSKRAHGNRLRNEKAAQFAIIFSLAIFIAQ